MKKNILICLIFFLFTINIFSEEWISEKGQRLVFINQTSIKFKENSLADLGPKIRCWKNGIISLSISNDGKALCDMLFVPDNFDILEANEWVSFLYSWFYTHMEDEKQRNIFMSIGFSLRYTLEFSRGSVEQYAALRRNGYVQFYPDVHLEAGGYSADNSDYGYLYVKYNESNQSWNSGYIYRYIIGDFDKIMDMPVPPGLDDSFKTDIPNIPNYIEKKDWEKFNALKNKYDLKLSKYLTSLIDNNAPKTVFANYSYDELMEQDYKDVIENICSNLQHLVFFYNYFDKSELELVKQYFTEHPDVFIKFCEEAGIDISTLDSIE